MRILFTISFVLMAIFYGQSQINTNQKALLIDSVLTACNERGIFNGSVLVADKGQVIFKKAFGVNDYITKSELNVDDRFYIGSMTKQFTSMLIFRLYEQGKLDIHQSISKYLHDFRGKSYRKITIYHLLTHTSGIVSYNLLPYFDKTKDYSTDQLYKLIKAKEPEFEAGEDYMYSNSGYYLLGKIIERITKKSYGQVLKEEILDPLEMHNTSFDTDWLDNHLAKGHFMTIDGITPMPNYSLSTLFSSGGMYSSVDDLYKWNNALYKDQILSDSLKYIMFTPGPDGDYASGWRVHRGYEDDVYFERHQHGGTIEGYHTFILRLIPEKQTVIVLDNFYNMEVQSIKNSIWSILEGRSGWIPKPMLSGYLYKSIVEGKLARTLKKIEDNRIEIEYEYNIEMYDINSVGYKLLRLGRLNEAKQVFELNTMLFPDQWNTFDSLGEVYFFMGNLEESKRLYEKSLLLNPKNSSAKEALAEINKLMKKKK